MPDRYSWIAAVSRALTWREWVVRCVTQRPTARVPVQESDAAKLMKLIDSLEESDDVGTVHANFDVDASVLERLAG